MSAPDATMFVPGFLDGSRHDPKRDDAYIHVRLSERERPGDALTVYLADGTALVVRRRDLVQLAPANDEGS